MQLFFTWNGDNMQKYTIFGNHSLARLGLPGMLALVIALALMIPSPSVLAQDAPDNGAAAGNDAGDDAGEAAGEAAGDDAGADTGDAGNVPMASGDLDRIVMKNGEIHDGKISGIKGGNLLLASGEEGLNATLAVPPGNIQSVGMKGSRAMFVKEKKSVEARSIEIRSTADGKLVYVDPDAPGEAVPLEYGWYLMSDSEIPSATWSFTLLANLTINRGNTNDTNAGLFASAVRESHFDRLRFEYEFGYSEISGGPFTIVSKRFHRGLIEYKYFLTDAFGLFARDEMRTDLIAGLQFRNVIDLGVSFKAVDQDDIKLSFDLSGNFVYEDLTTNTGTTYAGIKAAMNYFLRLAEAITLDLYADISLNLDDTDDWLSTIRATIKNELAQGISVGLILENNYDNKPAAGFKNNDFRIIFNVGIDWKSTE